jgi:hypothetical protein
MTQWLSPAPRVRSGVMDCDPGAHAPGFMLSCAPRTVLASYYFHQNLVRELLPVLETQMCAPSNATLQG